MITISESDDPVDICRDNVFKAVFTKDSPQSRGALSKLLSAVIGRELTIVSITATEPPIDNLRDRQMRFVLTCKGDDGSLSNVEVSLNPDKCEPVRLEFYAGKLFTGQDIRGIDRTYRDLKDAYQIAILVNGRFFAGDDFLHKFEYYDKDHGVSLGGRTHVITLELSKLEYLVDKPAGEMSAAERWAFYFRYLTDKGKRQKINEIIEYEEGIAMASEVLIRISRDEVERARLLSEYKYELDTQSRIAYAKQEGREEGRMEGTMEILKLIDAGCTPEEIKEHLKADSRSKTAPYPR
jgi:predicted transposase/invertase (TIGR01784 family)